MGSAVTPLAPFVVGQVRGCMVTLAQVRGGDLPSVRAEQVVMGHGRDDWMIARALWFAFGM